MFDDSLTDLILYPLEFERLADVVISLTQKTLQIMFTTHTFSFLTSLPYFQNHQVNFQVELEIFLWLIIVSDPEENLLLTKEKRDMGSNFYDLLY